MAEGKLGFLNKLNVDDLYNAFMGLDNKYQIQIGIGAVVLFFVLMLIPASYLSSKLDDKAEYYDKMVALSSAVYDMQMNFVAYQNSVEDLRKSLTGKEGGSPRVLVEKIAKEHEIGTNIKTLTESKLGSNDVFDQVGLDGKMTQVGVDAFLKFAQALETHQGLPFTFRKLQMNVDSKNPQMLRDVTFQVETIKAKGGGGGGGAADKGGGDE